MQLATCPDWVGPGAPPVVVVLEVVVLEVVVVEVVVLEVVALEVVVTLVVVVPVPGAGSPYASTQ